MASTLALSACALNTQPDTRPDEAATQPRSSAPPTANWRSAGELAAAKGAASCVPRSRQLSEFLGASGRDAINLLYFDKNNPREELISSVIASNQPNGFQLGVMDLAQDERCVATYEIIRVWASNCSSILYNQYPGFTLASAINTKTRIYGAGENLHLFTWELPAGGCLTLQKELLHNK
ncbi:MAG: hypothetical protein ABW082_07810 [Sedimenticola sp.]